MYAHVCVYRYVYTCMGIPREARDKCQMPLLGIFMLVLRQGLPLNPELTLAKTD